MNTAEYLLNYIREYNISNNGLCEKKLRGII